MADKKREEEPLDTHIIPENFVDTGRCFNGMFRTRNLLEGVAFAALPAYLIINSSLAYEHKIIVGVVVIGIIMVLFLNGINGDSFLEFLFHCASYHNKKRVAKYNPRVKMEAKPGYLTENENELPRDKILRIVNEVRNRNSTDSEEAVSRDIYDPMYQEFFEDDFGYVETPDDLKSKRELRKEAKARKRKEKEERKKEKEKTRAAEKENKKRNREELKAIKKQSKETDKAIKKEKARLKKKQKGGY